MFKGEAEFEKVRGVKASKKAGMMQMKDKSGNTDSLEYNKSQSACTEPNPVPREKAGEKVKRGRRRRRREGRARGEPSHNKDGNSSVFVTEPKLTNSWKKGGRGEGRKKKKRVEEGVRVWKDGVSQGQRGRELLTRDGRLKKDGTKKVKRGKEKMR